MAKTKIEAELKAWANPEKAVVLSYFFKTGKGQYGEGDVFWGVMVPQQRLVAKDNLTASLDDLQKLLDSKVHELRLTALLVLTYQNEKASPAERKAFVDFYLRNTNNINNWDLVDLSAPKILGGYLLDRDRRVLYRLAKSQNFWERRIAIISTLTFIRNNEFADTLKIAEMLLSDSHDLIQKAVGWMLREVGKKDAVTEIGFLEKHATKMPRTMLRYAIERFPEKQRKEFLNKK